MRRWPIITLAALAAVATTALAVSVPAVSSDRIKSEIIRRLDTLTGWSTTIRGEPEITVFPTFAVEVDDIVISGRTNADARPLATVPTAKASLRVLPLLLGKVEMKTLTLHHPRIHLLKDAAGNGNWHVDRAGRPLPGALPFRFAAGEGHEIVLRDGSITYEDRRSGQRTEITAADLRIAWQAANEPAELAGSFVWEGERVEIDARLDDPAAALAGRESPGRLTVGAEPAPESGDAALDPAEPWNVEGESALSSPPLRHISSWLGVPATSELLLGEFTVAGRFAFDAMSVTLSQATFDLDGNAAEGALALQLGGERPTLTGVLHFDELDLARYAGVFPPESFVDWPNLPVSARWLAEADIDLDATVDEVDFGALQVTDVATRLNGRDGRITVGVQQAALIGGRMAGTLGVSTAQEGIAIEVVGRLEDMSVAEVGQAFWAGRANLLIGMEEPIQGEADASFDLSARGATVGALVSSLTGEIVTRVKDGSVFAADMVATLERLGEGDEVMAGGNTPFTPAAGRTSFTRLGAHIAVDAGVVHTDHVRIVGERFEIALSGRADLRDGEMEAVGVASLFEPEAGAGPIKPVVELPFGIGGTVFEPVVAAGTPRVDPRAERVTGVLPDGRNRLAARDPDGPVSRWQEPNE